MHAYTRRQALADGVLVDVTEAASPAGMLGGFKVPVAVTAPVWAAVEAIPASLEGLADARGRLHDLLWMARVAAHRQPGQSAGDFVVILPFRGTRKRVQTLRIEVGPDDDGAPCVTIGFPGTSDHGQGNRLPPGQQREPSQDGKDGFRASAPRSVPTAPANDSNWSRNTKMPACPARCRWKDAKGCPRPWPGAPSWVPACSWSRKRTGSGAI